MLPFIGMECILDLFSSFLFQSLLRAGAEAIPSEGHHSQEAQLRKPTHICVNPHSN